MNSHYEGIMVCWWINLIFQSKLHRFACNMVEISSSPIYLEQTQKRGYLDNSTCRLTFAWPYLPIQRFARIETANIVYLINHSTQILPIAKWTLRAHIPNPAPVRTAHASGLKPPLGSFFFLFLLASGSVGNASSQSMLKISSFAKEVSTLMV